MQRAPVHADHIVARAFGQGADTLGTAPESTITDANLVRLHDKAFQPLRPPPVGQLEIGKPLGAGVISDMQTPIGAVTARGADCRAIHQTQWPAPHVARDAGPIGQDLGRQHPEPVRSAP
jgi:hypothetical protein